MMKVIQLVISDLFGAGRAAVRINDAVRECGCESEVVILNKELDTGSTKINLSSGEKIQRMLYKRMNESAYKGYSMNGYFHYDRYAVSLKNQKFIHDTDVIHVHWINEGIYSSHFLSDLEKPVVWTLHDMWPFTGGCHYSEGCRKYTGHCGECPVIGSDRINDLSSRGQNDRIKEYKKAEIQFVGCSRWITEEANQSRILKETGLKCINIPNPISSRWFKPRDRGECRAVLGINTNKKLILAGAVSLKNSRKGVDLLIEALKALDPDEYALCTFGSMNDTSLGNMELFSTGSVFDDLHLSIIYNACDVFAAPSREENLANTVLEALSCGVPAVAFDIGGMPDMILDGKNGALVQPYDPSLFAEAIRKSSQTAWKKDEIAEDIRSRFSNREIGGRYAEVYKNLIGRQ